MKVITYKASGVQRLKNVEALYANIIWVKQGVKKLYLLNKTIELTKDFLLLSHPRDCLTFKNIPQKKQFSIITV